MPRELMSTRRFWVLAVVLLLPPEYTSTTIEYSPQNILYYTWVLDTVLEYAAGSSRILISLFPYQCLGTTYTFIHVLNRRLNTGNYLRKDPQKTSWSSTRSIDFFTQRKQTTLFVTKTSEKLRTKPSQHQRTQKHINTIHNEITCWTKKCVRLRQKTNRPA